MDRLLTPKKETIIYEDAKVYACLARYPIAEGHTIVAWKKNIPDLHLLSRKDYEYFMDVVNRVRNALLKVFKTQKVYLVYTDEVKHVHLHLIPRFKKKGFTVLTHKPGLLKDFSLVDRIRSCL